MIEAGLHLVRVQWERKRRLTAAPLNPKPTVDHPAEFSLDYIIQHIPRRSGNNVLNRKRCCVGGGSLGGLGAGDFSFRIEKKLHVNSGFP